MVDQLSSGMIDMIAVYISPEDNAPISGDAQLALELQQLEEDNMYNME